LKNILNTKSVVSFRCTLWTGEVDTHGYGVLCRSFDDKKVKLPRVHRLAYYLAHLPTSLNSKLHVSHLCHNKLCITPNHLSYEPQKINNQRNSCKLNGECTGHRGQKKCKLNLVTNNLFLFAVLFDFKFCCIKKNRSYDLPC